VSGLAVNDQRGGVVVRDSTFTNVGDGVRFTGTSAMSTFGPNIYFGRSGGTGEVAVEVGNGASVHISGNRIDHASEAAVLIDATGSGAATLLGNSLIQSGTGVKVTGSSSSGTAINVEYNTIEANGIGISSTAAAINAANNWWGSAAGAVAPNNTNSGAGTISTNPILDSGPPPVLFGTSTSTYSGGIEAPPPTPGGNGLPILVFGSGPGETPSFRFVVQGIPGGVTSGETHLAYAPEFTGGIRVAVNQNFLYTIATAPGPGGGPHVKLFEPSGTERASFFAYDPAFRGGVYVALADVNRDGVDDVITGAGEGGAPHVKVFDGATLREILSVFAFDPEFRGGVRVATGDLNGDGVPDIIVGAGPGGGSHVRAFTLGGTELRSFYAYEPSFGGGVNVAATFLSFGRAADVITGAGFGGGPRVRAFDGAGQVIRDYFAFAETDRTGVNVAGSVGSIIAGSGEGGSSHVQSVFGPDAITQLDGIAFDPLNRGGVSVGGQG